VLILKIILIFFFMLLQQYQKEQNMAVQERGTLATWLHQLKTKFHFSDSEEMVGLRCPTA
jgi:hypothetical protein